MVGGNFKMGWSNRSEDGSLPMKVPLWIKATGSHDVCEFAEDRLVMAEIVADNEKREEHLWAAALLETELHYRGFSMPPDGKDRYPGMEEF